MQVDQFDDAIVATVSVGAFVGILEIPGQGIEGVGGDRSRWPRYPQFMRLA